MATSNQEFVENLATLQMRLKDALSGFGEIREKGEPDIQAIVTKYIALHTAHETELAARLSGLGYHPDPDGSFFSVVQRAIIKTRSIFTKVHRGILGAVADGEERISDLYADSIASVSHEDDQSMLERQLVSLEALMAQTRSKADAA